MSQLVLHFLVEHFTQFLAEDSERLGCLVRVPDDRPPFGGKVVIEPLDEFFFRHVHPATGNR